jgi:hypothetical protein
MRYSVKSKVRHIRAILFGLSLFALAGCNSGKAGGRAIAGKVSFNGQPVAEGQIVFEPNGPGRMGVGPIADGTYSIPAKNGPSPGSYRVRITADRATGKKIKPLPSSADRTPVDAYEQYIPARYNHATKLEITIDDKSPNDRDFELSSN